MSIGITSPTSGTTVTTCPVVVSVDYDTTTALAPGAPGRGLPRGWLVRCTFSKTGFSASTDQSLDGAPPAGSTTVTFGDGDIPNGTGYKVDADLIQPDTSVHSSALPEDPVAVNCT